MITGILLAESLRLDAPLAIEGLRVTRIVRRDVSDGVSSGQPPLWTFIDFEAPDELADELSAALADSLMSEGGWYADFAVGDDHVVVFSHRVFRYSRGDRAGRQEAEEYAAAVGVPAGQIDWTD